jgi:arylsulfatase A-like enzyme
VRKRHVQNISDNDSTGVANWKETPTIAEFFKKNGYSTYFSGKWHLGD